MGENDDRAQEPGGTAPARRTVRGPGSEMGLDVRFEGPLGAYVWLVVRNALLGLVTFQIYRFWGRTQLRRMLWSHTRIGREYLVYTGRGIELFLGFLLVMALLFPAIALFANWWWPDLPEKPHFRDLLPVYLVAALVVGYFYPLAFARGWRYRLSRTRWGVLGCRWRAQGLAFAAQTLCAVLGELVSAGLLLPVTRPWLWRRFWSHVEIGGRPVVCGPISRRPLFRAVLFGMVLALAGGFAGALLYNLNAAPLIPSYDVFMAGVWRDYLLGFALGSSLPGVGAWVIWRAHFLREAVAALQWEGLEARLDITVPRYGLYQLGNLGVVVFTLGIGFAFLPYRRFSFFCRQLRLCGSLDPSRLKAAGGEPGMTGEGLWELFGLGAV